MTKRTWAGIGLVGVGLVIGIVAVALLARGSASTSRTCGTGWEVDESNEEVTVLLGPPDRKGGDPTIAVCWVPGQRFERLGHYFFDEPTGHGEGQFVELIGGTRYRTGDFTQGEEGLFRENVRTVDARSGDDRRPG